MSAGKTEEIKTGRALLLEAWPPPPPTGAWVKNGGHCIPRSFEEASPGAGLWGLEEGPKHQFPAPTVSSSCEWRPAWDLSAKG